MYLEDKEFVNQVMCEFFERFNQSVADYAGAQLEFNNRICLQLSEIEYRLAGIDSELSVMNECKSTEKLTRHFKYWQKHALTLERDLQRLEAKFDKHYHVSQDEKIIMPFKDFKQ